MAKAGMRRPDESKPHGTQSNKKQHIQKNDVPPVPEIRSSNKDEMKARTPNNP